MVETSRHIVFPLVYRLIELALILPIATASVERDFLAMNIIKTGLRNRTSDNWLNYRMICYIERHVFASIDDECYCVSLSIIYASQRDFTSSKGHIF
uniref:HAT C-terminal dimerisation domain-containing protein n=1 Tax=Aegilops tauschii subsp. strangulata TaxID=200361 RepID=A0A453GL56_AEGTS